MMDMIKNDIRAAMDRAIKERIKTGPIAVDVLKDNILSLKVRYPNFEESYCRCNNCGRFSTLVKCNNCDAQNLKVVYKIKVPKPAEHIDLSFVV